MNLKVGVIMDPIHAIKVKKDTTLAMLLEAQRRYGTVFYMEQPDLFLQDDVVWARMRELKVRDDVVQWFEFGTEKTQPVKELDVVLMRKDPPVDMQYIYTTQLLDMVEKSGVLVVNKPQALRDFNEKLFIAQFPQCCVPTLVTHHAQAVRDFLKNQEDIICKPIDGMGGTSVFRLRREDPNINVILETLTQYDSCYMIAQRYIPEITAGDKRILLIDGNPVPYALARRAAPGETRANLAAGGEGTAVELTARDHWICAQVAPVLREKGLFFVGLDVIGDYLTEINITSPTCVRELDKQKKLNISAELFDCIEKKAH